MSFISGILTLANIWAGTSVLNKISKRLDEKWKDTIDLDVDDGSEQIKPEDGPTVERRNELLNRYFAVVRGDEEPTLTDFSPTMIRELQEQKALYNKLRIKREVFLDPQNRPFTYTRAYIDVDQLLSVGETVEVDYQSVFTDLGNGEKLDEQHRTATMELWLSKQLPVMSREALTCAQCGGEIERCGDGKAFCNQCGKRFDTTTANWVIASIQADTGENLAPPATMPAASRFYTFVAKLTGFMIPLFMLLPPVLAFFDRMIPSLLPLTLSYNVAVWGYVVFMLWDKKKTHTKKVKRAVLPNLSDNYRVPHYANMVTKQLARMRELQPADAAAIMDDETYRQWCKGYCHDGDYILDFAPYFGRASINKIPQEGEKQLAVLGTSTVITVLTAQRKIVRMERDLVIGLYHNLNSSFDGTTDGRILRCGCGRYIQTSTRAVCPYCGKPYDLADYDWRLNRVETNVIMDFGGKTYGTY